jgi:hypothetical protein
MDSLCSPFILLPARQGGGVLKSLLDRADAVTNRSVPLVAALPRDLRIGSKAMKEFRCSW